MISPQVATVSLKNLENDEELVRAVKPEAVLTIDGKEVAVGGMIGQPNRAFLNPEWLTSMRADPRSLPFLGSKEGFTEKRFGYLPTGGKFKPGPWPPKGRSLTLSFGSATALTVDVHYEIYDGIPVLAKWLTVKNRGSESLVLDKVVFEYLGVVEGQSLVGPRPTWRKPNLIAFSDYAFGGDSHDNAQPAIRWVTDPDYKTQVNYELQTPCDLVCTLPYGPGTTLLPSQSFMSPRTFLATHDGTTREREMLTVRKAYRTLAPWCLENPLMLHLTSTNPKVVYEAMDQAAECGFELVIFSFGSGLNMEDASPKNIARFKEFVDYGHKKGLLIGGYSLLASRRISDEHDVINPKTGKTGGAIFGNSPCLGSKWGIEYFEHVKAFLTGTGFDLLEHDGSYPGDPCASTTHPGHKGLDDSQWTQFKQITDFYAWCRTRGLFLNVPDWYFLTGSNKSGMGYRETNWSLPREQQVIHSRMNMFDGTWEKTPSMGWMMVPLVEYQGGGAAATIEPLKEHLDIYELHLMNCLGFGAQACYRGPRLYDSPETKAMVIKAVKWFKSNRAILESDVIHIRRADGRDVDGILHANPALHTKGLAMFYNPGGSSMERRVKVPLHYTGIRGAALIRVDGREPIRVQLDETFAVVIDVKLSPRGWSAVTFEQS